MTGAKKRSEQHLIDQQGESLLRSKLPRHWVLREYRPDYGLDFTIELFKSATNDLGRIATYESLGEHVFVQLKSTSSLQPKRLHLYARGNVEKAPERLKRDSDVVELDAYPFQIETTELVTVERMGVGVPVLLVISDLVSERCSFVCLNDYIDKILVPRHENYRSSESRTVHVPVRNEIGSEPGQIALRWYGKRPKLIAAFQRFTYQYSELRWAEQDDWRTLAQYFARRIETYDFWSDTEMCRLIPYLGKGVQRFLETGQPGYFHTPKDIPEDVDERNFDDHYKKLDVFELWRQLSLLPKTYEDVWREWFLPTFLGDLTSAPD